MARRRKRSDVFERLETFAVKATNAGWQQIWQVTDKWWMVGFQRGKAVIIASVIGDRLRVFSPTNQKFHLASQRTSKESL